MLEQQEVSISSSFYLLKVKLHLKHLASAEMEALVHAIFTISRPKPDPTNPLRRLFQYHTQMEYQTHNHPFPSSLVPSPSLHLSVICTASDNSCSEGLGTRLLPFPMCDTENDLRWGCMDGSGLICETTTIVAQWVQHTLVSDESMLLCGMVWE